MSNDAVFQALLLRSTQDKIQSSSSISEKILNFYGIKAENESSKQ